ncbi:MAG: Ig-like domain-containing protein, partial [Actinomycetales bacterium]
MPSHTARAGSGPSLRKIPLLSLVAAVVGMSVIPAPAQAALVTSIEFLAPATPSVTVVTGESLPVTVQVAGDVINGTPTGNVTLSDGDLYSETNLLVPGMSPDSSEVSFSPSFSGVGAYSLTANYAGDGTFDPAMTTPALDVTVNQASTTTGLSVDPNPSDLGQSVILTATVSVTAPGSGAPTGQVSFFDGATLLGSAPVDAGMAGAGFTFDSAGAHTLTAQYLGDANFVGSTSTEVTQTVNQAATSMTAMADPASVEVGGTTMLSVTGLPGAATGTVDFAAGGSTLCTATLP